MNEAGDKTVITKQSSDVTMKVDRLSNLPESMIFEVLLKLSTKDVVKTSALSSTWKNLWRYVPGLDLISYDFPNMNDFLSFGDSFTGFNSESCLQYLKLKYHKEPDTARITRWINTAVNRNVQHLYVSYTWSKKNLELPPTIYTCESLVYLNLHGFLILPNPELVSLPCLKDLIVSASFQNDLGFETLISGCPALETLKLFIRGVKLLRVCSQSLLKFILERLENVKDDLVVAIDTPRLEYLTLVDYRTSSFILNNTGSLVKAQILISFNLFNTERTGIELKDDLLKRNIIRNFLIGISSVKVMNIIARTLEIIYGYSIYDRVPLFRNLSFLTIDFSQNWCDVLPIFLESCPNLKSLSLLFWRRGYREVNPIVFGPRRSLASLEYVEIKKSMNDNEAVEMKLASYILENSTILKKFTFCLPESRKNEESVILEKLLTIPRLSISCEVVVVCVNYTRLCRK